VSGHILAAHQLRKDSEMTKEQRATLQVVWEQLNAALYDITEGSPADAAQAIEDCIAALEAMGISA
jgi:hypothetical protein